MVDPELYGSSQVLHFSEPPLIMDLAASAVKSGSRPGDVQEFGRRFHIGLFAGPDSAARRQGISQPGVNRDIAGPYPTLKFLASSGAATNYRSAGDPASGPKRKGGRAALSSIATLGPTSYCDFCRGSSSGLT